MDVDAVMAELSVRQLAEWRAFYQLEPFGGDWHRSAMVASMIANANRDAGQKPDAFTLEDFLPKFEVAEFSDGDPGASSGDAALGESEQEPGADESWRGWKAAMQALADASKS